MPKGGARQKMTMDEELKKLQDWLESASLYELPSYKELPTVPLYMEQVVGYINKTLAPLSPHDSEILTSYMVNNYVKAKIIKEPERKKYNEVHLGYLLAICSLKNSLTMSELSNLIALDNDVSADKSVLYSFFRLMSTSIAKNTIALAKQRVDRFVREYEKNKETDPEQAEQHLVDSLGLIALRMSIQSSVNRIIAEVFLNAIQHSDHAIAIEQKKHHKVEKHSAKASKHEAEKIFEAKEALLKEKKKHSKEEKTK